MTDYFTSREEIWKCPSCNWEGKGEQCDQGDVFLDLYEAHCPRCTKKLGSIMFSRFEDIRANWDKADDFQKFQVEVHERFIREFEQRKLRSADQLPDIGEGWFTLTWGYEDRGAMADTVISSGDQVIWKEPAMYEGSERFAEVAGILKARYGRRLRDLVPTPESLEFLYGEKGSAIDTVKAAREALDGKTAT